MSYLPGYSPAHFAASWGHSECLRILIEHGVHMDLPTKYEEVPKQLAVRYNQQQCIQFMESSRKLTINELISLNLLFWAFTLQLEAPYIF